MLVNNKDFLQNNNKITAKTNSLFFYYNPVRDITYTKEALKTFLNRNPQIYLGLRSTLLQFFSNHPGRQLALWVEDAPLNQMIIRRTIGALYEIAQDKIAELLPFFLDACKSDDQMPILFNIGVLTLITTELQKEYPELKTGGSDVFLDWDLGSDYLINGREITGSQIASRLKQHQEAHQDSPIRIIPNSTIENAFGHDGKFNSLFISNDCKIVTLDAVNGIQTVSQYHNQENTSYPSLALGG